MKNSKRIAALCMCSVIMATSLTGCKSNETNTSGTNESTTSNPAEQIVDTLDFYSAMIEADKITDYNYEMDFGANITSDDQTMKLNFGLDGTVLNNDDPKTCEMAADITMNLAIPGTEEIKNINLTDVIFKPDAIYVNMKKIISAMPQIATATGSSAEEVSEEDIKAMFEEMGITTDYVKLDIKELESKLPELSGESLGTENLNMENIDIDKLTTEGKKFIESIMTRLNETFSSLKTQFIGKENGRYTFNVTNADTGAICDALITFCNNDFLAIYDEFVTLLKTTGYNEEKIASLEESRPTDEMIAELVANITSVKENPDQIPEFAINCTSAFTGSEAEKNRSFDMDFKANIKVESKTDIAESTDYTTEVSEVSIDGSVMAEVSTMIVDFNGTMKITEVPDSTTIDIPEGEIASMNEILEKLSSATETMPEDGSIIDETTIPQDNITPADIDDYSDLFSDGTF